MPMLLSLRGPNPVNSWSQPTSAPWLSALKLSVICDSVSEFIASSVLDELPQPLRRMSVEADRAVANFSVFN